MLQRSFQRALHRDPAARLVTNPDAGPLFSDEASDDDQESGTIYVLRSKSDLPVVAANHAVLHKIGVTGRGKVTTRFANAKNEPTFLLADVEDDSSSLLCEAPHNPQSSREATPLRWG